MLDYDGTLAPFQDDPLLAVPQAGAVRALDVLRVRPRTTVALVTGRPLVQLVRLLPGLHLVMAGEHGWETRDAAGRVHRHDLEPAARSALRQAAEAAAARAWGAHLERKRTALTLHVRGLPAEQAAAFEDEARRVWSAFVPATPLRLVPVSGGLELRATGRDKGTFVRELWAELPPGTLPVYLGDDWTDEDAFRVVHDGGIGIRVGPEERASLATGRLPDPGAVVRFLDRWAARSGGATAAPERSP